jgi:2-polyprenyl-6-methoxyphenol hydroxylase-like FAD-dependent oxidoreductase
MALEDVFILMRVLQQGDDLPTAFKKYDIVRRPRIAQIAKYSKKGGDMRRETGQRAQWVREQFMWVWLKLMPTSWMSYPFQYDATTIEIPSSV